MIIDPALKIGFRLRRLHGRIVVLNNAGENSTVPARRALFLLFSRDIPDAVGSRPNDALWARAERGVLVNDTDGPEHEQAIAVTSRHPHLDDRDGSIAWSGCSANPNGTESLFVPLFVDLVDLAARMELSRDASVIIHGSGPPFSLLGAPLMLHCARAAPAGAMEGNGPPARHQLLFRPDLSLIETALAAAPDGSSIALYDPEADNSIYDFYPHVHRRGLRLVHGAPGEGRALSEREWSALRGALRESSIPRVRLPEPSSSREPQPLDLEPDIGAFILEVDI